MTHALCSSDHGFLVSQQPQLLQLVLISTAGSPLERAVIVPHHRNVHLAADRHGTVGGTFLFLDVVPSVCRAQFVERGVFFALRAVATPCGTVDVDGHIGPFLCSAALDFYAVHYQTVFIVTGCCDIAVGIMRAVRLSTPVGYADSPASGGGTRA